MTAISSSLLFSSTTIPHFRSQTPSFFNPLRHPTSPADNLRISYTTSAKKTSRALVIVHATPEVAGDFLSGVIPSSDNWFAWAAGVCVSVPLIISRIIALSKQVEAAAESVEKVADVVGNVANQVDKAAEEFKENLPAGKLKTLVERIEHVAEKTAKDAQIVEDLMDKVEEIDDKLEGLFHASNNKPATAKAASPVEEKKA